MIKSTKSAELGDGRPKKQLKSEEKKKDSSIPGSSEAEDEEEEIAVDSEQKKGNECKHAYKIRFSGNP